MKKTATILLLAVIISSCHHSSSPTPSQTTTPPSTSSNTPANVTALCGNWIEDSTAIWAVTATSYTTADTTWHSSTHYSNPTSYHLNLSSNSYTLTTSQNVVVGYEYQGINPATTYNPGVWKITGDTVYFPGDNNPVIQQLFYGIEKLTAHELVFTTRAYCAWKLGHSMSSFNKYYYHK